MGINSQLKTIVNIPGWVDAFGDPERLGGGAGAYGRVPLVYRCTRLIADSLSTVELKVYTGKGESKKEVEWPFEIDTVDWTWRTVSSILLTGASYSVGLKGLFGSPQGLQWLDPTAVSPEYDREKKRIYFKPTANMDGAAREWSVDEMVYIHEVRFGDSVKPGPCAAGVALGDAELSNYLTKFASYYFAHGAMPLTIIPLPTNTSDDEVKRVERMWKSMTGGIKRAWSIMGLRIGKDGGQPYTLTSMLKDLMMPQLEAKARKAVADAFGIPITMLDDAANYATANEHNSQFWKTCVRPHGVRICAELNKFLKREYGIYAEYAFEELDEFQEDEANRADSVVKLVDAGMPLVVALDVLGYDLTAAQREKIEAEVERQRAVQERIASAEAGGGASQNPPNPPSGQGRQGGQGDDQEDSQSGNSDGQNRPSPTSPRGGEGTNSGAVRSALFNWKAAALKAVKTGHDLKDLDFDHPAIPEETARNIRAALRTCKSADEVQGVFRKAREWMAGAGVCDGSLTPSPRFNTTGAGLTSPLPLNKSGSGQVGEGGILEELKRANDLLEMSLQEERC